MATRRGHEEGSISKRANGRWTAVVALGSLNERRQRTQVYGKTRREVDDNPPEAAMSDTGQSTRTWRG